MVLGEFTILNADYGATPAIFTPAVGTVFMLLSYGGKAECKLKECHGGALGEDINKFTTTEYNDAGGGNSMMKVCCTNSAPLGFDSNLASSWQQVSLIQVE